MEFKNKNLVAGTLWEWTETPVTELNPTHLQLILKKGTSEAISHNSDSDFKFSLSAVTTSAIPAGDYHYQILAVEGDKKELLETGVKNIQALLSAAGADPSTYWENLLALLRTAYEEAAAAGWAECTINGRTVVYDRAQLLKEINNAEVRFEQEKRKASGKKANRTFLIRFS